MSSSSQNNAPSMRVESGFLTRLAIPLVLSSVVNMGISLTDVIMMGWLGSLALASGAVASDFYSIVFYFASGVVAATSPLISHARGAGETHKIRSYLQAGFLAAFTLAPFMAFLVWQSNYFFTWVGVQPEIVETAIPYANMMALAVIPMVANMVWHHFLAAHGRTKLILYVTVFALPLNALGNYVLMFGKFGFPEMGLAGAGLSSFLTGLFIFIIMTTVALSHKEFKGEKLFSKALNVTEHYREIFRVGAPIGISNFGFYGVWLLSTILMGIIGAEMLAAHAVALRMAGVVYTIPFGMSQATTVRVSHAMGANNLRGICMTARTGMLMGLVMGTAVFFLVWQFNDVITGVFLSQADINSEPFQLALVLLIILAAMQPFEYVGAVAMGVLRGIKDTKAPMYFTMVIFWGFGFAGGILLAFTFNVGGIGIWIGLIVASITLSLSMITRVFWQKRKIMKEMLA